MMPDREQNRDCDIVIIGGGIIGVCTAYYLAKAVLVDIEGEGGASNDQRPLPNSRTTITILEVNAIASGASGKAGGFLAKDWHSQKTSSLGALSFDLHADLARELDGEAVYGYRRVKCFGGAVDVSEQEKDKEDAQKQPMHMHIVDVPPAQPTRTHPSRSPASISTTPKSDAPTWLCSPEKISLVADEETTAQVHPYLFTQTIFQECLKLGVKYVQGRAIRWDGEKGVLNVLKRSEKTSWSVPATKLIITAGPWSGRVASELIGISVPVTYLPGHSLILQSSPTTISMSESPSLAGQQTQPHSAFIEIMNSRGESLDIDDITRTPEIFLRPDGTIYVAGENTGAPLPEGTEEVESCVDPVAIEKLRRAIRVLGIQGAEVRTQLCYRPLTQRGPIVGELGKNVYIATGHGPWGISLAPGTGKVLSELVLGHSLSADVSSLRP